MKIIGTGLVSVDNIFLVKKNGTFGKDSEVEGVSPKENLPSRYIGSHGGGSTSNTLCVLSKLGYQSSIVGAVGSDGGERLVREEFNDFGVNSDFLFRKSGETRQFSHLIYPQGHVFTGICPICRNRFRRAPSLDERDLFLNKDFLKRLSDSEILHIDRANKLTLKLVVSAYQDRKIISFDFGYQASLGNYDIASEIIKRATILKTSRAASRTFLSRMNRKDFRELNPNLMVCVTTLGDMGAQVTYKLGEGVKSMSLQAFQPRPIVDQGGAGDAFHAGLLYGLRDTIQEERSFVSSESAVIKALRIAQGLGGLACTDYGARGYFIRKLKDPDFETSVMNDVEKLVKGEYTGSPRDPDVLFSENRSRLLSNSACGVCGRPFLANETITFYESRIDSSPWAMSTSYLSGTRSRKLESVGTRHMIYFVGSGASFSVALFGALLLNQLTDNVGIAMTPYDYVSLSKPDSSVVLISFGGQNPDILATLEKAKDLHSFGIHVITGNNESVLARTARGIENAHLHLVPSKVTDAGFVSSTGMLACTSTLLGILSKSLQLETEKLSDFFGLQNLTRTFHDAKKEIITSFADFADTLDSVDPLHIVALGSGWAWPVVVDFEARMTEGAVCTTEISELKNFTHGRYLNAYRNKSARFFVVFGLPSDERLVRFLKEKLSRDFPVLLVRSGLEPPLGTVDLLVKELYISSEVSKRNGLDIAKAIRFPKESRGLFSWGPIFSPAKRIDEFVEGKKVREDSTKFQAKLS